MCNTNLPERVEGFDDMLNDCYEPWKLGAMTYYPADILFDCDPIAYSQGVAEWADANCKDGQHEYNRHSRCMWCADPQEEEE